MASQTKANLLSQHAINAPLNAPLPPQVTRGERDFSADEMFSPLDERIIAGASEAMEAGQTHYVDVPGIAPLREAMADFLNGACGTAYQSGNIIVTAGVQEARFLTIQKIGELYDSIALPAVVHPGVQKALGVRQRNLVTLPADSARGYLPSLDSIAEAVASGCRLLYLESPSRLSGAAFSADEVAAIGQISSDNDVAVIWDQGLALWIPADYCSLAAQEADADSHRHHRRRLAGHGIIELVPRLYRRAGRSWVPSMQSQKQIMAICTATATQYAALEASRIYNEAHERAVGAAKPPTRKPWSRRQARRISKSSPAAAMQHPVALRAGAGSEAAFEKLRAAGSDGIHFGAPDVIRLTVNNSTLTALS